MTREEAKDYIREWCPYDRQEEIIKVLEQGPCEDAISRQAVLDGIAIIVKAKAKSDAQKSLMGRVLFFTEHLPPVNPQPETGYWVADVDRWGDIVTAVNGYRCDKCNTFNSDKDNYCPNCGAKMIEPQESEGKE